MALYSLGFYAKFFIGKHLCPLFAFRRSSPRVSLLFSSVCTVCLSQVRQLMLRPGKLAVLLHHLGAYLKFRVRTIAKQLEADSLTAQVRVGEEDRLFGSVTAQNIADLLAEKNKTFQPY